MSRVVVQNYSAYPYSWPDRRRDTDGNLLHTPDPFYCPARGRDEASGSLRPGLCTATEETVKRAQRNSVMGPLFKTGVLRVGKMELMGSMSVVREHESIIADEAAAKHGTPRAREGVQLLTASEMAERAH